MQFNPQSAKFLKIHLEKELWISDSYCSLKLVLSRVPEYSSTSLRALSIESHCLTRLLAMNANWLPCSVYVSAVSVGLQLSRCHAHLLITFVHKALRQSITNRYKHPCHIYLPTDYLKMDRRSSGSRRNEKMKLVRRAV